MLSTWTNHRSFASNFLIQFYLVQPDIATNQLVFLDNHPTNNKYLKLHK